MSASDEEVDPQLVFTVATVWRQARISCPHPDLLQSWLQQRHGIKICIGALWSALVRLGLRFKKNRARQRAGAGRRAGGTGRLAGRTAEA